MLYIHHATLLTPEQTIADGAVLVVGQSIAGVGTIHTLPCPAEATPLDATGLLLAPGFIDLQLNGAFGLDFTADPESIWAVAARLPQFGVTAFLPTIITSPLETVAHAQHVLKNGPPSGWRGALPIGLHLEGPFLNPLKRGAHNPKHMRTPDVEAIVTWSREQNIALVTLAPELPGAIEVIQRLRERGVVVSAGHSMATYEETMLGNGAGISYGTHLFNAMPALEHRAPNLPGALLADERVVAGLIADGIHLHPGSVKLAWRAKGPSGLNLVTDAMAALGMSPGRYHLGDFEVVVDATSARLSDGRLAGSILSLDTALRNLITFTGCSINEAIATVTCTPARLLNLSERGQIAPGFSADLVLLTSDLQVAKTIVAGEIVYSM